MVLLQIFEIHIYSKVIIRLYIYFEEVYLNIVWPKKSPNTSIPPRFIYEKENNFIKISCDNSLKAFAT